MFELLKHTSLVDWEDSNHVTLLLFGRNGPLFRHATQKDPDRFNAFLGLAAELAAEGDGESRKVTHNDLRAKEGSPRSDEVLVPLE